MKKQLWVARFKLMPKAQPIPFIREDVIYVVQADDEEDAHEQLHEHVHVCVLDRYDLEFKQVEPFNTGETNPKTRPLEDANPNNWYKVLDEFAAYMEPWLDNSVQFPRLISELEAAGVFGMEAITEMLGDSMDLMHHEIWELVIRAQKRYDKIKAERC